MAIVGIYVRFQGVYQNLSHLKTFVCGLLEDESGPVPSGDWYGD